MAKNKTAISPIRLEDYAAWYQEVIKSAELAENSDVRGCMVIRPWGYAIWEKMQRQLDDEFKLCGVKNAYFPLLIPLDYLQKEAEHVEGFAKECAVVTHHRLSKDKETGELIPDSKLEKPFVIRPTSETIIGHSFAKWISSYRNLPLQINQWCNIMRWEMRTRLFLRTAEILWQEGHTAHATKEEALEKSKEMIKVYEKFMKEFLAIPVMVGEKTPGERFPGADLTYTVEAIMQDGKALQLGTSHFLGQNFSKAQSIQFLDKDGEKKNAWTTSWGVTTRMIGGLIMVHADDNGLVLPPRIASEHVVFIPIYKSDEERERVLGFIGEIRKSLEGETFFDHNIHSSIDDRDIRGGEKFWSHIKSGIPAIIEVGPRDEAQRQAVLYIRGKDRPAKDKKFLAFSEIASNLKEGLIALQGNLFNEAKSFQEEKILVATGQVEFEKLFKGKGNPVVSAYADPNFQDEIENLMKKFKVTARCLMPGEEVGVCIFTGKENMPKILFARAY